MRMLLCSLLALTFFLVPPAGGPRAVFADEADKPSEGDDLGDQDVPFHEQVNEAITKGTYWLHGKPTFFSERKNQFATWGLVKGSKIYGGGTGPQYRHPAGPTALALYTLLKCGVDPKDPVIEKGFNWLREKHTVKEQWDGTDGQGAVWDHTMAAGAYENSVMILALTAKYDQYKKTSASRNAKKAKKLKIKDREDREWLVQLTQGLIDRRGYGDEGATTEEKMGWRYNTPKLTLGRSGGSWIRNSNKGHIANQDLSSTQLATLALFSAARFGVKVPVDIWKDVLAFTLRHQEDDGPEVERHVPGYIPDRYGKKEWIDKARGFVYIKGSPEGSEGKATGSMTCCGIANLLICREMIAKDKKARAWFMESGMLKKVDQSIHDGLAWLDRNWSSFQNPKSRYGYHIYYLYCMERAMDILGKRLVGKRLWYPEGAKQILSRQKKAESTIQLKRGKTRTEDSVYWMTDSTHEPKDVLDTCFALLYLKRATQGLVPPTAVTGG